MRGVFAVALAVIASVTSVVFALDPERGTAQFHHTKWTAKEGAPSQISALAQTTDGFLWIGSARGLFTFDGVRFEPFVPRNDVRLPSHNIYTLMATPDGGLWVSFRPSGLGFIKDGRITLFDRPEQLPSAHVNAFARDPDGRIWAGTPDGLALYSGTRWTDVGAEWNMPRESIAALLVDREGTLWAGGMTKVLFLRRGAKKFEVARIAVDGIAKMVEGRNGELWISEDGVAVRRLRDASMMVSASASPRRTSSAIVMDPCGSSISPEDWCAFASRDEWKRASMRRPRRDWSGSTRRWDSAPIS